MARNVALMACGVALGLVLGAAAGIHADPAEAGVNAAAEQAGVDPQDLLGAMVSTGIRDPFQYLRGVGELPPLVETLPAPPAPRPVPSSPLAECIIRAESRGDPNAVNPRSHAAGLGQFLASTWATTPAGKAGLSVFNAEANRAMVNWMIAVGRAREFSTLGLCR